MWWEILTKKWLTLGQIDKMYPDTSIPGNPAKNAFESRGIVWVERDPRPDITDLQVAEMAAEPEHRADGWYRPWVVSDRFTSQAEIDDYQAQKIKDARVAKQREINDLFNTEIAVVRGPVVQHEIDTFETQEKEALAYQADSTADVPLLSGLAAVREITIADLVGRVLAHATAYKAAVAQIMGKKHRFEDLLDEAQTEAEINAIIVE